LYVSQTASWVDDEFPAGAKSAQMSHTRCRAESPPPFAAPNERNQPQDARAEITIVMARSEAKPPLVRTLGENCRQSQASFVFRVACSTAD
jgi:hypothetical protein